MAYWIDAFSTNGIPAGPVLSIRQALEHPQVLARQTLTAGHLTNGTQFRSVGPAFGIKGTLDPSSKAPELGEDTHAVLTEYGFSKQEIQELAEAKTVFI